MSKPIKIVDFREVMKVKNAKRGMYVLAYLPKKDEWVTWGTDKEVENFYWGHYFKSREAAEADFELRGEDGDVK